MEEREIYAAATAIRSETADWLETLSEEQLDTQSLCEKWRVRDVAGHLLAPLVTPVPAMMWRVVRSRLDPHRANTSLARELGGRPVTEVASRMRENAGAELNLPFVGAHGPLTDLLVHNADMRVPLDQAWQPDPEWVAESLEFVAGGAFGFTTKKRLSGLRLVATDTGASYGGGAELRGPAFSLVLALCGRRVGLENLDGPGVKALADRL